MIENEDVRMSFMKLFFIGLVILLMLLIISCQNGDQELPHNKFNNPDTALKYFFEACASMDSIAVDSLSIVTKYPLLTDWKIRRIENTSEYLSTSEMKDTIKVLRSKMQKSLKNIDSLRYSLKNRIVTYDSLKSTREKYRQAQLKWENAELERIKKGLPKNYRPTEELKNKKNQLYNDLQMDLKIFSKGDQKKQERIETKIASLEEKYDKYRKLLIKFMNLITAVNKSININTISLIPICLTRAYVDIQIPSKLGVMLNKKAEIKLVSGGCNNKQAKWIITDITYLGE